jgi:site-specific recombinase XerD
LETLIQDHAFCLSTEGKSQKTIEWYAANLGRFARFLADNHLPESVNEIGVAEARRFISHLQTDVTRWQDRPCMRDSKRLSAFSVQGYARTIKAFWSWLLAEGYIQENLMAGLKVPRVPRKVIATFAQVHIQKLLGALNLKDPEGFRDYTIILILLDTGVRLSELINLDLGKVDLTQSTFSVMGKGNKERIVPFGVHVRKAIWRYLSSFRPEPAYPQVKELLLTRSGLPLRPRFVQSVISRLGLRAGISGVRCSAHTFRHTFAKHYLMNGGDVFSLQRILGHSSLEMVNRYINLATNDISERHRQFSPVDNLALAKNKPYPPATRSYERHPCKALTSGRARHDATRQPFHAEVLKKQTLRVMIKSEEVG